MKLRAAVSTASNLVRSVGGNSKASGPLFMQIEPTNYCNQTCGFCQRQNELTDINNTYMTLERFKDIVDQMPTLKYIMLSGYGEPLLNKDLPEMIKYGKSRGIVMQTNTNMTLLTEETANRLVESGLDELFISLDSLDPKKYQLLRGTPLEAALKGLKNIVETKRRRNSKTPYLILNYVLVRLNTESLEELKRIIDIAAQNDIKINFKSLAVTGALAAKLKPKGMPELEEIKHYAKDKKVKVMFSIKDKQNKTCYRIWFGGYISAKGDLYPCCDLPKEPNVGNVEKGQFINAWNGKKFVTFRQDHVKGTFEKHSNYVKRGCENCNLTFNDKIHLIGKHFRK